MLVANTVRSAAGEFLEVHERVSQRVEDGISATIEPELNVLICLGGTLPLDENRSISREPKREFCLYFA
jgi:hypothetical protein